MKPIKFDEANKNLLKPQNMTDEECSSLWVFTDVQQCFRYFFERVLTIITVYVIIII